MVYLSLHQANATTVSREKSDELKFEEVIRQLDLTSLTRQQAAHLRDLIAQNRRFLVLREAKLNGETCRTARKRAVESSRAALKSGLGCEYNGLEVGQFRVLRDLCDRRGELKPGHGLGKRLKACRDIGRKAPEFTPPVCPPTATLRVRLNNAIAKFNACETTGFTLEEINNELKRIHDDVLNLVHNGVAPSNEPFAITVNI